MRNLSIGKRLLLIYVVFVLLLGVLGSVGIWAANLQNSSFNRFQEGVLGGSTHALLTRVEMLNMRRYEKDLALNVIVVHLHVEGCILCGACRDDED